VYISWCDLGGGGILTRDEKKRAIVKEKVIKGKENRKKEMSR
jgi:hypothetical protein